MPDNTETVQVKLPSGEMINAVIPAGMDDASAKAYMTSKRPDLFGQQQTPQQTMPAGSIQSGPGAPIQNASDPRPQFLQNLFPQKQGINAAPIGPAPSAGVGAIAGASGLQQFMEKKQGGADTMSALKSAGITAGTTLVGGKLLDKLGSFVGASKAGAGAALEDISQQAKQIGLSVDPSGPAAVADRAMQIDKAGGTAPKVIKDFVKRLSPTKASPGPRAPLTWQEASDFMSQAGKLSSKEIQEMTAPMQRQVAMFAGEMRGALNEAADSMGKLDIYGHANREFANAAKMTRISSALAKWGTAIAGTAALGGAGYAGVEAVRKASK